MAEGKLARTGSGNGRGAKRVREDGEDDVGPTPGTPTASLTTPYTRGADKSCIIGTLGAKNGEFVASLLASVPPIKRISLADAAEIMRPRTRWWLGRLGRDRKEVGVEINLPHDLDQLDSTSELQLTPHVKIPLKRFTELCRRAIVTSAGPMPKNIVLKYNAADKAKGASFSAAEQVASQLLMISGPVLVLYDGGYNMLKEEVYVTLCSTPGINFAYSDADRAVFVTKDPETGSSVIDKDVAKARMMTIWRHILHAMDKHHGIEAAVLCGIGCGAFKGSFGSLVPRLWAEALGKVLQSDKFSKLQTVYLSLPTFGSDNNFDPFRVILASMEKKQTFNVPCVLVEDASMVDIALFLSRSKKRVAILNPSDIQALRHGWIGMYWDGGHIALEEILAMQTTALSHHIGLNPDLYVDPRRRIEMSFAGEGTRSK